MKRERDQVDSLTMASCLMLLSHGGDYEATAYSNSSNSRVFECKTCNRHFPSFQALGGHRTSHKKPKLMAGEGELVRGFLAAGKPKTHKCSICGLEYAAGQALGGHMRRHRAAALNGSNIETSFTICSSSGSGVDSPAMNEKKVNKERFLFLDLNLTPLENDLEILKIGKAITR